MNTWRQSVDSLAAAKGADITKRAREVQTPGKRPFAMSSKLDFDSPLVAFIGDLDTMLGMYGDLFCKADATFGEPDILPLCLELDLGSYLYAQFERSSALEYASV